MHIPNHMDHSTFLCCSSLTPPRISFWWHIFPQNISRYIIVGQNDGHVNFEQLYTRPQHLIHVISFNGQSADEAGRWCHDTFTTLFLHLELLSCVYFFQTIFSQVLLQHSTHIAIYFPIIIQWASHLPYRPKTRMSPCLVVSKLEYSFIPFILFKKMWWRNQKHFAECSNS